MCKFLGIDFEMENRILDRQIEQLMAVSDCLNRIIDKVPFNKKYTYELLQKEYWENSHKLRVLFSVQDNIQKMIDYKE